MYKLLGMLGIILAVTTSFPSAALADTIFGSNLIVNGDAETGVGAAGESTISPPPGFLSVGHFTLVKYGASGGFPTFASPGPVDRGLNFFAGGQDSASSSGSQVIDVSTGATSIDTGAVKFDLSAFLGGFDGQGDYAKLSVSFRNSASTVLGSASIGPVSNTERSNVSGLLFRETSGLLPAGTRFIDVNLLLTRLEGSYDDGYADNLSLNLTAAPVPEPETYAMMLAGLGLLGFAARRRKQQGA